MTASGIFRREAGARIPESDEEMAAMMRRSGARPIPRNDMPEGCGGAMLRDSLYLDMRLPLATRRKVAMQLWARFLCWRDRGGPPVSLYEQTPGRDPYSRVAGLFERIATEADPLQPKREPTLY